MFRRVRPPPPGMLQCEFAEIASEMSLDDLRVALDVFQAEMDRRQGREKYVLPEHVRRMIN